MCLACPNARVHPTHHGRLAHLHHALDNLRTVMDPGQWQSDWAMRTPAWSTSLLVPTVWARALVQVSDSDRALIDDLRSGSP